ncbi:hypothetical protein B5M09_012325 [Aphanomyces astaci]|uniref:Tyrosine specific protein phosphatases domain-containing protein n=1 Tax=Aphanomyces astaci TaxID=112090 RepID=A0A3R8CVW9_APHAT|nr:hypothetical protein B5M09_012325 [Aphanomyces astaci]
MTSDLMRATVAVSVAAGMVYVAFQLHLLPRSIASVVSRVYFFPTWPLTYLSRRSAYYTLVDSHVFLGAAPMEFMGHVSQMTSRGVRAVVNMCDEYDGPVDAYKKAGISHLRLPTPDHTEPSLANIRKAIEFIEFHKAQGSRVYVHCKAGAGRSAAVVFCWLLQSTGWSLDDVHEYLSDKRRVRRRLKTQPNVLAFFHSRPANQQSTLSE